MQYENIAGMVTIYNPDRNVCRNLNTYSSYLDKLYIVINSEIDDDIREKLNKINNSEIIDYNTNLGIAKAINVVLDKVNDRYDWLLTMDQDSFFIKDLDKFLEKTEQVDDRVTYGITTDVTDDECTGVDNLLLNVDRCITSGMLLNVKKALFCGGFDERLFIDEVDHEFCYRCNSMGYKLYKYAKKIMNHKIGNNKQYKILGVAFFSDNEKYFRQYYIFRNSLYVMKKYKTIRWRYAFGLLKRLIKIVLVEKDRRRKIDYIIEGIIDFAGNKMGRKIFD